MTFGERLRAAMDARGLNAYQVAKATDVTITQITRALKDERTDWKHFTLTKVALACGVRPEWLSLEEGQMVSSEPVPLRHLRDRKEWRAVAAKVRLAHRELLAEDVEAVGALVDEGWPVRLDAPLVATLAAARRAWLVRQTPGE